MKMELNEAKETLENSGFLVEAKMGLKDKLNNAKQFNKNKDLNKDEILLIKIAKENGYELIGKDKDDDGSNRFIFEKKYRGETISFNASLYYENNDCQINYDFDYESGNDYFDETWGDSLKTYEDEAIREIDDEIEESEWEDEDIDEALEKLEKAGLICEADDPYTIMRKKLEDLENELLIQGFKAKLIDRPGAFYVKVDSPSFPEKIMIDYSIKDKSFTISDHNKVLRTYREGEMEYFDKIVEYLA